MRGRKAYSMADVEDPAQGFATPRRIMKRRANPA